MASINPFTIWDFPQITRPDLIVPTEEPDSIANSDARGAFVNATASG